MDRAIDFGRAGGRWIVAPRKGAQFLGPRDRARARARARRRRVFVTLLEAAGLTFLMGLFPPTRPMWFATAALGGLLVLYVWMLLVIREREGNVSPPMRERFAAAAPTVPPTAVAPVRRSVAANGAPQLERYVAAGTGRATRPTYNGLGVIEAEDVHVVVRSPRELVGAGR